MLIPMNPMVDLRRGFASRLNVIAFFAFLVFFLLGLGLAIYSDSPIFSLSAAGAGMLLGLLAALSPKVAKQWERGIVLRLGKYHAKKGPGLFWITPLIDSVSAWTIGHNDTLLPPPIK